MKERPILFSAPMVRAILDGTKTQTRRVIKIQPDSASDGVLARYALDSTGKRVGFALWYVSAEERKAVDWYLLNYPQFCPYGQPGDRLWVREAFIHEPADYCWEASVSIPFRPASTSYRADFGDEAKGAGWKPSIHMPRALSRITLEITSVRVERLQEISEADAQAEGVVNWALSGGSTAALCADQFRDLWQLINGAESWTANPLVWVVEFKRVEAA